VKRGEKGIAILAPMVAKTRRDEAKKSIGLTTSSASADYISLYHGNAALLMESLELVQQTAAVILAAIRPEESVSQEAAQEAAELPAAADPAPEPKRARRSRNQPAVTEGHEAVAEVA
jgi:hypothetical protein